MIAESFRCQIYDDTILITNTVFECCPLLIVLVAVYFDIDKERNHIPGEERLLLLVVLEKHAKKGNLPETLLRSNQRCSKYVLCLKYAENFMMGRA